MPEPTFFMRRSARSLPVKALRDTTWRYSSFLRNCSSKRSRRSSSTAFLRWARATVLRGLGRALEHVGDDLVRVDARRLALEVEQDAVAQRRRGDPADVVDRHRVAPLEERADLGAQDDGLHAARRAAVADELLHHVGGDLAG